MCEMFELAAGSVGGREHVLGGRNNQDAVCTFSSAETTIAVVADGCSSARHSEVGAKIGTRIAASALVQQTRNLPEWPAECVLEHVRLDVLASLRALAEAMGGDFQQVIADHFLFTLVGACVTSERTYVFAFGDGVVAINGTIEILTSPENRPSCLAYGLLDAPPADTRFAMLRALPTRELQTLLVGTDGVADLAAAAERCLPGREERIGPLAQFWERDAYFANPAAVGRRLTLANRESSRADWAARRVVREHGVLPDDTTLVAIRRRRSA
jgi:hypothetical protein